MGYFTTPEGKALKGTFDMVPGCATTISVIRYPDGSYVAEYDGNGTEMWWDDQHTVIEMGQPIWIDEDGKHWPQDQLLYHEEDDVEPGEGTEIFDHQGLTEMLIKAIRSAHPDLLSELAEVVTGQTVIFNGAEYELTSDSDDVSNDDGIAVCNVKDPG